MGFFWSYTILSCVLIIFGCSCFDICSAGDNISSSQFIKDPQTISSNGSLFTLGFFSPENSTNRYVGIWYKSESSIVWVANRNQPLRDSSGIVTISEDGNLVILDGQKQIIWSSNVSNISSNSTCKLLDSGNLVLLDYSAQYTSWQSFEHPSDTYLPNLKLTSNKKTGEKLSITSWKGLSDPSIGNFYLRLERLDIPEVFIWNGTRPYWRSGPWNGRVFTGISDMNSFYLKGFTIVDDGEGTVYLAFTLPDVTEFTIFILNFQGILYERDWLNDTKQSQLNYTLQKSECDIYGLCGAFGSCNSNSSPTCNCLRGFEPSNSEEWNRQNWTNGCFRKTALQCERVRNGSADGKGDGFLMLQTVKVADFAEWSSVSEDTCRSQCLENCTCVAYSYTPEIGCMSWTGDLIDIQQLSTGGNDLYVRLAYSDLEKGRHVTKIITITVIIGTIITVSGAYLSWKRIAKHPDPPKHKLLDWRKRFAIIEGIARGVLYLHRDSRLKIIHRDLKASNILLDENLNPKISDFGMARIFEGIEDHANTKRVVGTYGYMSPEYAMEGLFSEKSDVFSFGVLLLEIISGRRNSSFYSNEHSLSLLAFAWKLWNEENIVTLIDPKISDPNLEMDILRYIHIGLLCVQDLARERPSMSTVVSMLNSEIVNLPPPKQPAFIQWQSLLSSVSDQESYRLFSNNVVSITNVHGR